MSKIVVVMTCHNRREKTTGCLEKLHDGNNNNEYHYIVVDAVACSVYGIVIDESNRLAAEWA